MGVSSDPVEMVGESVEDRIVVVGRLVAATMLEIAYRLDDRLLGV